MKNLTIEKNSSYEELKPHKDLRQYIQSFWVMRNIPKDEEITVLPDGCFDIVIYILEDKNDIKLTGIWDKPIKVKKYKDINTVGVRFFPSALDVFFNMNISEIKNTVYEFDKSILKSIKGFDLGMLYTMKSTKDIISFWDLYFIFIKNGIKQNSLLNIDSINIQSVEEVAINVGVSSRHLSRVFNQKIGISTKNYVNILRFIKAKNMLVEGANISEVAHICGYSDQSHFIKEFKRYSSFTPKQFIKRV